MEQQRQSFLDLIHGIYILVIVNHLLQMLFMNTVVLSYSFQMQVHEDESLMVFVRILMLLSDTLVMGGLATSAELHLFSSCSFCMIHW
jgi:hypothetical protein